MVNVEGPGGDRCVKFECVARFEKTRIEKLCKGTETQTSPVTVIIFIITVSALLRLSSSRI